MGEIKTNDLQEVKSPAIEGFREIKPQEGMTIRETQDIWNKTFEKPEAGKDKDTGENREDKGKEYFTSRVDRINQAKGSKGEWLGEIGNSEFRPESEEAREILKKSGVENIPYKDGFPDFSSVAIESVEIDDMTDNRPYNFKQTYEKLAEKFNHDEKDGKTNWTARDVERWKTDNNCECHEKEDRKTVEIVPASVHKECKHYGGRAECKLMKELTSANKQDIGGGFDE